MVEPSDALLRAMRRVEKAAAAFKLERNLFHNRGFDERTIDTLVAGGIDAPERLLFMTPAQLANIPGVGKSSLAKIEAYRKRFSGDALDAGRLQINK